MGFGERRQEIGHLAQVRGLMRPPLAFRKK